MKKYSFWSREYVTVEKLFDFVLDSEGNRCGYLNREEALAHGFTEKQWNKFYQRCKTYMQDFLKNGYCDTFPITVVYCKETRKYYLADGQGRVGGMRLAIELGKVLPFNEVPVQNYICDTLDIVHEVIREINIKKSISMSSSDLNDIDAKVFGGEVAEIRAEIVNYRDNVVKLDADYVPELLYFGCSCSHTKHSSDHVYDKSCLRKYYETYCSQYAYFLENVGKTAIETGVMSEERVNKLIRKQALAILIDSYYRLIEKLSEKFGLDANEKIAEATQRIVKYWNDKRHLKGTNFIVAMNTDKGAKAEFSERFDIPEITLKVFSDVVKVYGEDIWNACQAWQTHAYDKRKKNIAV